MGLADLLSRAVGSATESKSVPGRFLDGAACLTGPTGCLVLRWRAGHWEQGMGHIAVCAWSDDHLSTKCPPVKLRRCKGGTKKQWGILDDR